MKILGQSIVVSDSSLLQQALTHRSKGKNNNERLEFLGDSVLSLVVSKYLYDHFPTLTEGDMSRLRAQLVKGKTLAEIARHYGLGNQIKLGPGEIKSGGVNKSSVLADAVEAVYGAILLDQGYQTTNQFILAVMEPWLADIDPNEIGKDAKTGLQEFLQKQGLQLPAYETVAVEDSDNDPTFEVTCQVIELQKITKAVGKSRKKAEQIAAAKMMESITND
ncbi:ribonuclease III [Marinicella gelatinilytica]|uniref:ribonuclease III n=1 Tax=Marinicella gelatinilytica TaxID=2996017 RepID=UPI002260BF14|nr:ribonuclease III [Marinicella gelatinilytica]MCX7544622.1 ribonuclease III [Marinicella gelatinilytica]